MRINRQIPHPMNYHSNPTERRAQAQAFTLIELLVVMAIIALLAALSFGGFTYAMQAAYRNRTVATLSAISSGLEQYKEKFGEYPEPATPATLGGSGNMRIGGAMMLYQALTGDGSDQIKLATGTTGVASDGVIDDSERPNVINGDFFPIKDSNGAWKSKLNATFVSSSKQFMLIDGFGHPYLYEKAGSADAINATYDLWSIAHSTTMDSSIYTLAVKQDGTKTAMWLKNW